MRNLREMLSDSQKFEFIDMFNQISIFDETFMGYLPKEEFELTFDVSGNIYVNGQPLGVNVKHRFQTLQEK
jgi:hypothetical protein